MDNPLYSQHQEDNEHDDEQDNNDLGAGQGNERDDDQGAIDPGDRRDEERDNDQRPEIAGSYTKGLFQTSDREESSPGWLRAS